jgi:hypothetical protein
MSNASDENAHARFWRRNLPKDAAPVTVTTSQVIGTFPPGTYVIMVSEGGGFRVNAGAAADANDPLLPADMPHDFTVPDANGNGSNVAIHAIGASAGVKVWCWEA